ncbi:MAG: 2OG-Fe(II) oxygenase [Pseudomonadota bacterium]
MGQRIELAEGVFIVRNLLRPQTCREYIELAEQIGFEEASLSLPGGALFRPDIRNNTRANLDSADHAEQLWCLSKAHVPPGPGRWRPAGLNERLRFYRYESGEYFDWHYDGSFERSATEASMWTFMVYLNSGFGGGETLFEGFEVLPETGLALFFEHQRRHKGEQVMRGRKYVLRSDVMCRLAPDHRP